MNKIMVFILVCLFQTTLFAESLPAQDSVDTSNQEASKSPRKTITPTVGSQYNLDGMEVQGGKHKKTYSTGAANDRKLTPNSPPSPYGTDNSDIPVVPLIIITDE